MRVEGSLETIFPQVASEQRADGDLYRGATGGNTNVSHACIMSSRAHSAAPYLRLPRPSSCLNPPYFPPDILTVGYCWNTVALTFDRHTAWGRI